MYTYPTRTAVIELKFTILGEPLYVNSILCVVEPVFAKNIVVLTAKNPGIVVEAP
jgi:hypothetical protein